MKLSRKHATRVNNVGVSDQSSPRQSLPSARTKGVKTSGGANFGYASQEMCLKVVILTLVKRSFNSSEVNSLREKI